MNRIAVDQDALACVLRDRLAELAAEVAEDEAEVTQPLDPDFSEQANELEDVAAARGIEAVHLAEWRAVRDALRRIDNGTYGVCFNCGEPIEAKRLEAQPTATRCLSCA